MPSGDIEAEQQVLLAVSVSTDKDGKVRNCDDRGIKVDVSSVGAGAVATLAATSVLGA